MLHSERAAALEQQHKALSSLGKRIDILKKKESFLEADEMKGDETSRLVGEKLTSADETGKSYNLLGRSISIYLRISNINKRIKNRSDKFA